MGLASDDRKIDFSFSVASKPQIIQVHPIGNLKTISSLPGAEPAHVKKLVDPVVLGICICGEKKE